MKDHKRGFWLNLMIILVLIGVVAVRTVMGGGSQTAFTLREDSLTLTGPGDFMASFEFANVASLEFRETLDRGGCVDGGSEGGYAYGIWENEELGQYTLHVLTKVKPCIVVTETDGGVIVFNVDDAKTTEEFARSLTEHLKSFP